MQSNTHKPKHLTLLFWNIVPRISSQLLNDDAREGVLVCGFGGSPHTVVGSLVESQLCRSLIWLNQMSSNTCGYRRPVERTPDSPMGFMCVTRSNTRDHGISPIMYNTIIQIKCNFINDLQFTSSNCRIILSNGGSRPTTPSRLPDGFSAGELPMTPIEWSSTKTFTIINTLTGWF